MCVARLCAPDWGHHPGQRRLPVPDGRHPQQRPGPVACRRRGHGRAAKPHSQRSAAQQAVAIGIGLFGVAASFSAQVLARRKEFGLLAHLGLTRRQILAVVAGEGAAWTGIGAIAGVLLGLAVSVVLVHVVNPQSFHWTMEMNVPAARLWALCAAVVVSGTVTAWLAGRAAAGRDAVMAVKEDW